MGDSWNAMTAVPIDTQETGNGMEPRKRARTSSQRFCSEKLNWSLAYVPTIIPVFINSLISKRFFTCQMHGIMMNEVFS